MQKIWGDYRLSMVNKLYLDKLEQILDIDIVELIQSGEKNICF